MQELYENRRYIKLDSNPTLTCSKSPALVITQLLPISLQILVTQGSQNISRK